MLLLNWARFRHSHSWFSTQGCHQSPPCTSWLLRQLRQTHTHKGMSQLHASGVIGGLWSSDFGLTNRRRWSHTSYFFHHLTLCYWSDTNSLAFQVYLYLAPTLHRVRGNDVQNAVTCSTSEKINGMIASITLMLNSQTGYSTDNSAWHYESLSYSQCQKFTAELLSLFLV